MTFTLELEANRDASKEEEEGSIDPVIPIVVCVTILLVAGMLGLIYYHKRTRSSVYTIICLLYYNLFPVLFESTNIPVPEIIKRPL